jgi:GTP-binding protein
MASGRIRNQVGAVSFVAGAVEHWPDLERPEIAFAGRSNVGKSSALNCILKRRSLARVSGRPGRTQEINFFAVGNACIFADLPGYGFARVPDAVKNRWKGMIGSYLAERDTLRLVVLLVDVRHAPQAMDGTLLWGLREASIPSLVVATKIDKLKRSQRARHLARLREGFGLPKDQPVAFSALTGEGRDVIWDRLEAACRD